MGDDFPFAEYFLEKEMPHDVIEDIMEEQLGKEKKEEIIREAESGFKEMETVKLVNTVKKYEPYSKLITKPLSMLPMRVVDEAYKTYMSIREYLDPDRYSE